MDESVIFKTIPKIDTTSASGVDEEIKAILSDQGVKELIIDMTDTFYISSVGLRILLSTQKLMNARKGSMILRNVRAQVKEVFDVTGFSGFLTIEE